MNPRLAGASRVCIATLLVVAATFAAEAVLCAMDQALAMTRFQALIRSSTSLRVSDHLLAVAPRPNGYEGPVLAGSIEFRAAARTASDGEVILTVEPLAPIDSLAGGAGAGSTTIDYEGIGEGAQSGALRADEPGTVARWVGPGLRSGRIVFTVRGPVAPHGATLPLRFLLAAP
jgi:hypothetical protein